LPLPLYLACGPGETPLDRDAGRRLCRMGYRLTDGGWALLAPEPPELVPPDWILLPGDPMPEESDAPVTAALLARCCAARSCGLLADFPAAPDERSAALAAALGAAFSAQGSVLVLPEAYAALAPKSLVLISSAISGGVFDERLREAAEAYPGRCVLELEPVCALFPLPCADGCGRPLAAPALCALRERGREHFSPELLCRYIALEENETLRIALFDTVETLSEKRARAEAAGFLAAVGLQQELRRLPAGGQSKSAL